MSLPSLSLDPFDRTFLADPYAYHGEMRDVGPVSWIEKYGIYAMARYEEVRAALGDPETYCSGRGVGLADFRREEPFRTPSLLIETDAPRHDVTRSLMNKVVTIRELKTLLPVWRARAFDLVEQLIERGRFDGITDLAEVYPMMVFPDAIGLTQEGREHLLIYASAVFNAFGPQNDIFHEGNKGVEPSLRWVEFACRRENLSPDGWGMAVHRAGEEAGLPERDRELLVRSFLTAGVDTTVNGIGNMLLAFSQNPDQWDRLRADPSLSKRAFEESLRWDSTVQTFFRTTTREVTVAGIEIPAESKVLLFLAAANRDPRRWQDSERFDIGRIASGHVGFGYGVHQCLGQMVARQEGQLMLSALVEKVRSIRPAGPPERRINNTLRALGSLPLEVEAA